MEKKLLSILFLGFLFFLNPVSGFGQCPTSVSISADPGTTICEGTPLTFTANASGGSSYTYEWYLNDQVQTGQTGQIFELNSVTNSDKIKVIASSSAGTLCTPRESTVTMTVNASAPVSFNINANKTAICPGESVTFSAGPITNGGTSPTYQWLQNGNPIANATNSTYATTELTGAETISLQLTSNIQCAVQQNGSNGINVTVNSLPNISTTNSAICASGQTNIDLSTLLTTSGTSVSFYTSETNAINKSGAINKTVSPTTQTTYYVRSELSTGCFVTDSIVISINALPAVDAGPDQSICPGGSFDLSTIGSGNNLTYYSSQANANNATNQINSVISPSTETTYYVRSENTEGCYNTDSVTIKINILPTLSTSNASVCADGQTSVDLNTLMTTNGTATFYTSQTNADNKTNAIAATVSPTSQTTYYVRSELSTGCYTTDTLVISIDALPTLTVTNGSVCASNQTNIDLNTLVTTNGTTVSFHSSQANAESNSSLINEVVSPSTTTTYYVRSANSQGCYNTAAIQISIDALPTVDAGSDAEICIGESFNLSSIASGSGSLTYYTTQANADNKTSPLASSTVSPTITTTYFVRSESNAGCYSTDTVVITVNPNTTLALTSSNNNQTICRNSPISNITYSIGGGGTGANVTGLPTGVTSSYNSSIKVFTISGTPTVAGTFNFEITTTGCGTASATGTIKVDAPVTSATPVFTNNPEHNPTAICPVVSGLIYSVNPIEGATSYLWTLPAGWVATTGTTNNGTVTTSTNSVTVNVTSSAATGNQNIKVRANNSCGSSNQSSLPVTVNTFTSANAGPDQTVCKGITTVQLNGEVGGAIGNHNDYDWSDNGANGKFIIQGNNKLTAVYELPSSIRDNGGTITLNLTTIKPSKSSCQAATDSMTITVLPDATISSPTNKDQTLCINTSIESIAFNIGGAGTGATAAGLPTGVTGIFSNGVFTLNGTPTVSGTFNYTINTTGTCTNQTSIAGIIRVDPITIAVAGAGLVVCQSSNPTTISLTGSSVGGGATTGAWSITSGGGTLSDTNQTADPSLITYTPVANFYGEVELTLTTNAPGKCAATTDTRKILIELGPTIEAGDPITICQSSSPAPLTLSGATFGGGTTTAAWSISSGGGTLSSTAQTANPQNITYTPAIDFYGEVILTLTTNAPGTCNEVMDTKVITIDPVPIVNAGTSDPVCQSSSPLSLTLNGASVSGGGSTAAWSITSGGGTLSSQEQTANPSIVSYTPAVDFTGTVTLTLTTNTPGICTAVSDTREIIIEQAPTVMAGEDITICHSQNPEAISLSGSTIGGGATTGVWTLISGEGTLSSSSPTAIPQNITFTPATSYVGEIILTLTSDAPGACETVSVTRTITVNQAATIDAGQDITICSNETATLAGALGGGATSGTWISSGSGSFSNNNPDAVYSPSAADVNTGTVTLTYTTNDPVGPCEAVSNSIVLTIKEEIIITTQPQNVGVCVTNPASLSVVAYGDDLTYQWYKGPAPGSEIQGATSATLQFTQASLNDADTYYVIVGDGSTCTAITSNEVTLNVNQDISIQTQPISQVVCLGSDVTFSVTASGAIDSYQWRKNGVEIPNEFGTTFTIAQTTLNDEDVYDVKIYGIGGTCEAAFSAPFTLTVKENPIVDAGDDFEVCNSASPFNIATHPDLLDASSTVATTLVWTTNGGGTISNQASLTDATYAHVAADLGKTLIFTLTGIVEVDGVQICEEALDTKEITIIPQPEITAFTYTSTLTDTLTEFCETDTAEKSPTIQGNHIADTNGSGVFTVDKPVLVVNSSDGTFTPNGTPPGVYVVTYTFNATSETTVCTEISRDFTVTIGANPVATFAYDSDIYCKDTRDSDFNIAPIISFTEEGHEDADSFSADKTGLSLNAETGAIDLSTSTTGTYLITRTVDYAGSVEDGCQPVTAEFTITINDRPIPDFIYDASEYCSDPELSTTISPVLNQNGVIGVIGEFTYAPDPAEATLVLDSQTGEIDLTNSDAGTFIITNTVDFKDVNEDSCDEVSHEFTITISKQPKAAFEYTQTDYCIFQTSATVKDGYQPGGTFSSTTLGDWLDSETGEITWTINDNGIVGTHTITYGIEAEGVCLVAEETFEITIDALPVGGDLNFSTGRIFMTCENAVSGYAEDLILSGYTGQITGWEYRNSNSTQWVHINNTANKLEGSAIEGYINNLSTIFRAKISNGACANEVFSATAIVSVIPSDIKPSPVEVAPEVVCFGGEIELSSKTGYGESFGKFEGGDFTNAGIKNQGWRFTNPSGGSNDYDAGANNGRADHWLKMNASGGTDGKVYTGDLPTADNGGQIQWTSLSGVNEKFALVTGDNDSYMETPVFSLGALDQAVLTFDQGYNLTTGATISVEISTNGGNSYERVLFTITSDGSADIGSSGNYTDFGGGTPSSRPKNKMVIDLGDYLGQTNLRVRFNYNGSRDGDVWAVDNIKVPEGPQNVLLQWFYDDNIDDNALEQIGQDNEEVVKFTPRKIGWNDFEVKTAVLLDSNGNACESIDNSETIKVFVFDQYTTEVEKVTGPCGNFTAELNATTTGAFQGVIPVTDYPTIDGYVGSWVIAPNTGYTLTNQDPTNTLDPVNNPNVIFEAENFGDYTITWELTTTFKDENDEIIANTGCPPTYTPLELPILACTTLDFDGIDDYVDLGLGSYAGTNSIEAWIYPEAGSGTIISLPNIEINMGDLPAGVTPNTRWYHIAVSGGELFVDGISMGSSGSGNGGARSLIGASWNAANKEPENYFSGWIEEVRIWKKDLTKDQIHFMMNQHLQNAANMGIEIPMPVPGGLTYADLAGYYRLISAEPDPSDLGAPWGVTFDALLMPQNGETPDLAINKVPGRLYNMTTNQENTAPMPYISAIEDQIWGIDNTWLRPAVWNAPNSKGIDGNTPIDWNIARINHNIDSGDRDITVLGLKSETAGKLLNITGPGTQDEYNLGQMLRVTHYLLLNGNIDLVGESQLLQDPGSILAEASAGYLERDQQGKRNSFVYNYWSSPVSPQGAANNAPYSVKSVLMDGTTASDPQNITFIYDYWAADGATTSNPITISTYWLWGYSPAEANIYAEWDHILENGTLKTGEGFTMKGTNGSAGINEEQNYTFRGKPHNGDFDLSMAAGQNYLIGNPYPSSMDADEFIFDNLINVANGRNNQNVFDGALYFWDHFQEVDHILKEYIGGYATYNLSGGVPAISNDERVNANDAPGEKYPGQYIPVGQAFLINSSGVDGGNVHFKNSQRIFKREKPVDDSQFLRPEIIIKSNKQKNNEKSKIRISFKSPIGYHRQILVGAIPSTTNGFDLGYDALLFDDNAEDMYWLQGDNQLVIQGVPNFDKDQVLPLGVKIKENKEFRIKIDTVENAPEGMMVYLNDKLNDSIHDLRKSAYSSTSEPGLIHDRFKIIFYKDEEVLPPVDPAPGEIDFGIILQVRHAHNRRELQILNPDEIEISNLYLFDLNGNLLENYDRISNEKEIRLPVRGYSSGVYVVKVYAEGKIIHKKIIISN